MWELIGPCPQGLIISYCVAQKGTQEGQGLQDQETGHRSLGPGFAATQSGLVGGRGQGRPEAKPYSFFLKENAIAFN